MKVISEGAACQIIDLGGGRILRRFKRGGDSRHEAAMMNLARSNGFPAPAVLEVRSDGLVLERVSGPTMHEAVIAAPTSSLRNAAKELVALHQRLHRITTPSGAALVHGDLHWKNVICSPSGSVVIDWANAEEGDPQLDTALTWVILATSSGPQGRALANHFADITDVETAKPAALRRRLTDANLSDASREAIVPLLQSLARTAITPLDATAAARVPL